MFPKSLQIDLECAQYHKNMPSFLERILLLPSALLALSLSHALGAAVEARDAKSTTVPAPISYSPDQNWDGIDGTWSSFSVQIGTPPQTIRTFPSWASYQTWGVVPAGCNTSSDYKACAGNRGGIFDQTKSKTWDEIGLYELYIEQNLGYEGNAYYGYDVVTLGMPGEDGPTLENTIVGGFAWDDFYIGLFGINPKPTNFTSFNDPSSSFMSLLKQRDYIPSVSFGYTAGAKYRFTGELASLTLGGYDTSKFIQNDVEFAFAPDNSRDIVVALQSISTPSQIKSSPVPTELLPYAIYAYLDATVAELWLPIESCRVFEYEFGLTYDNYTQLYLVNNTLHQQLLDRDASITLELGKKLDGGETVSIEMPYAAFDLTVKPPYQFVTEQTNYFPLRRAMNDSQYTIGRTFFQEAYIAIDWEGEKFNVSQRAWNQDATEHLVAITPAPAGSGPEYLNPSKSGSSNGIGGGEIAGIVVGAVAGIVLIALALFFCLRRGKDKKAAQHEKLESDSGSTNNTAVASPQRNISGAHGTGFAPKAELVGSPAPTRNETPEQMLSSGGLGSSTSNSASGSGTPRSHQYLSGSTWMGQRNANSDSPTTPSGEGEGTSSSNYSNSSNANGTSSSGGNVMSPISPLSPGGRSEVDSKERPFYHEMAGDMPTINEKDGYEKSEKEALAHRERVYNGVDSSSPSSAYPSDDSAPMREPPRQVNPEDVARGDTVIDNDEWPSEQRDFTRHRAFSFEDAPQDERLINRGDTFYRSESSDEDLYR